MDDPQNTEAEVARIRHELELEAKRRAWSGAAANTTITGGLIGWLVARGVAKDESQAKIILLAVAATMVVLAVAIYTWGNSGPGFTLAPQEQQLLESSTR